MKHVENIFNNLGMTKYLDVTQLSVRVLFERVKLRQNDTFLQQWNNEKSSSFRGKNYSIIKEKICLKKYLTLLPQKSWIILLKFRTSNHHLPFETGRWTILVMS